MMEKIGGKEMYPPVVKKFPEIPARFIFGQFAPERD